MLISSFPLSVSIIYYTMPKVIEATGFVFFYQSQNVALILKVSAGLAVKVALTCRTTFC